MAKRGGVPLSAPALSAVPDLDPAEIQALIERWGSKPAKLAIFQTGVGTRALFAATDALGHTEIDAVVFTSASQVQNLFAIADRSGRAQSIRDGLNATLVASIGPVCSEALREHGVSVGIEAQPPKLGPLIAAIETALA